MVLWGQAIQTRNFKGSELPESEWYLTHAQAVDTYVGVTGSRILVSNLLEMFAWKMPNVKLNFPQILHLEDGDSLELRMTQGDYISQIILNIELIGLGFD